MTLQQQEQREPRSLSQATTEADMDTLSELTRVSASLRPRAPTPSASRRQSIEDVRRELTETINDVRQTFSELDTDTYLRAIEVEDDLGRKIDTLGSQIQNVQDRIQTSLGLMGSNVTALTDARVGDLQMQQDQLEATAGLTRRTNIMNHRIMTNQQGLDWAYGRIDELERCVDAINDAANAQQRAILETHSRMEAQAQSYADGLRHWEADYAHVFASLSRDFEARLADAQQDFAARLEAAQHESAARLESAQRSSRVAVMTLEDRVAMLEARNVMAQRDAQMARLQSPPSGAHTNAPVASHSASSNIAIPHTRAAETKESQDQNQRGPIGDDDRTEG